MEGPKVKHLKAGPRMGETHNVTEGLPHVQKNPPVNFTRISFVDPQYPPWKGQVDGGTYFTEKDRKEVLDSLIAQGKEDFRTKGSKEEIWIWIY